MMIKGVDMNYAEIIEIDDSKFFNVLSPVKKKRKIIPNPLIIGFDTEYVKKGDKQITVSIQFSTNGVNAVIPINQPASDIDLLLRIMLNKNTGEPVNPEGITESSLFSELLVLFILNKIEIPHTIYLISHFAQAELSNLDSLDNFEIFQASRGLFAKFKQEHPVTKKPITIHIKDLSGIFATSLEKVGSFIGIPKVLLDGVGHKSEDYWKEHMDELFDKHPKEFSEYAVTDSIICYEAYKKIRELFIEKYEIDILHSNTLPSIAGYLFKKDYLQESVTKTKQLHTPRKQRKLLKGGNERFYDVIQKLEIYDGSLDVRLSSLFSYHGARVESFYRGRIEDQKLTYYDVDSLYPSSAMLQALPCNDTEWVNIQELGCKRNEELLDMILGCEGFVEVDFSFPDNTLYPCLPVSGIRDNILYFPLNGISHCTLSELKLAQSLGADKLEVKSGFVFIPTDKELNHPLKRYVEDLHKLKNESERGSIEYQLYKLLMNTLIGKFVQRDEERLSLQLLESGKIERDTYNKLVRNTNKTKRVGNLWSPEWASLILGKARAIISEFVVKGAYFVSTDSVLLPSDADINCSALEELKIVGSDLKREFDVDHGVLIRTRLYALNPLEEDSEKQHIARHAVSCKQSEFLEIIKEGYTTKEIPNLEYQAKRLTKYRESLRTGRALNSERVYESEVNLKYDGKRKLIKEVANPFKDNSWSQPLSSIEVINNQQRKQPKLKPGRKKGEQGITPIQAEIIKLYKGGKKQNEIVKRLGVTKGYVSKVVKKINSNKD